MGIEDVFGDLPVLETTRLVLRKMTLDDAGDMFEYARDPEVAKYVTWDAHRTIDDTLAFLRSVHQRYREGKIASWGMEYKLHSRLIGTCGFVSWKPRHNRAEIGYALSRAYWGKGVMTEAVREVIRFGFEQMKLNRIEARCKVQNLSSERVMQKVGMRFEGILREVVFDKGEYHDLKLYSILKNEYWPGARLDGLASTSLCR